MTAAPSGHDPEALAAWTLRSESEQGRDELALIATGGVLGWPEVLAQARSGGLRDTTVDRSALAALGHVAILSAQTPAALEDATRISLLAHGGEPVAGLGSRWAGELAQALLRLSRPAEAEEVRAGGGLSPMVDWAIRLDRAHPLVTGSDPGAWMALLAEPFTAAGLEPVLLSDPAAPRFTDLTASAARADAGQTISVVMSVFRPDRDFVAAARAVLNQSWEDLELLVIDDATPPGYEELFAEVAALDDRVRLLRAPRNAGTYQARNLALDHVRGAFLTFHDSDDWVHPRRLELQVRPLLENPALLATRSWAIRAYADLTVTFVGYPPNRINASSLMVRTAELRGLAGGFDTVRKSADVELPNRLKALRRGSVLDLPSDIPTAITQLRPGSLSRQDARPGWIHWSRITYRDRYYAWHSRIRGRRDLGRLLPGARRPFPLPLPSWAPDRPEREAPPPSYDVVVVGDWRTVRPRQSDVLDLVRTLRREGLRVAVASVEAPRPLVAHRQPSRRDIPELLRTEAVDFVHVEQQLQVDLVLVSDPACFELLPGPECRWAARTVAVLVRPQRGDDDADGPDLARVHHNLTAYLGTAPVWTPQGEPAAARVRAGVPEAVVASVSLLEAVPVPRCQPRRAARRHLSIGHHMLNRAPAWPATREDLVAAYPVDGQVPVLLLFRPRHAMKMLRVKHPPPGWIVYGPEQPISPGAFLAQLDCFVATGTHPGVSRAARQALAAGCLVVLDPAWRAEFGAAAGYAAPDQVRAEVQRLGADPDLQAARRAAGLALVRQGSAALARQVRDLAAGHGPPAPVPGFPLDQVPSSQQQLDEALRTAGDLDLVQLRRYRDLLAGASRLNLLRLDNMITRRSLHEAAAAGPDAIAAALAEARERRPKSMKILAQSLAELGAWDALADQLEQYHPSPTVEEVNNWRLGRSAKQALAEGATAASARLAATVLQVDPGRESAAQTRDQALDEIHLSRDGWPEGATEPVEHSPQPERVLSLLGQSLPWRSGGYATRSHGILTSLADRGWQVTAATRLGFPYDELWWDPSDDREVPGVDVVEGIPYHRLIVPGRRDYPRVPLVDYVREGVELAVRLGREQGVALVHASSLYDVGLLGLETARRLDVPFVYEMRGLKQLLEDARLPRFTGSAREQFLDRMEATVATQADRVLVITEALGERVVQLGVDPGRIVVVPNGVHVSRFTPRPPDEELRAELGLGDRTVIGYAGGLVVYEGLELLLEAAALLRRGRDDFHLLVVGDGVREQVIRQHAEELDLGSVVTFTGRVPHEEIERYLSLFDITPFPRLPLPVCELISPIKPFEAMAMGKAVVASDVAALTEIVTDGQTGRIFTKADAGDLARVLADLLDDRDTRETLGRNAQAWVTERRDWARITESVDTTYRSLLTTSAGSRLRTVRPGW